MGTRADFWIEGKNTMEWIGSIAANGHPENFIETYKINTQEEFRNSITSLINEIDYGTLPEQGYPFRWDGTGISDHTYVFRCEYNKVYEFVWERVDKNGMCGIYIDPLSIPRIKMPSLKSVINSTHGKRGGTMYPVVRNDGKIQIYEGDDSKPTKFPKALFKMCPYCKNWKFHFNGKCKCKDLYGNKLVEEETNQMMETGLVKDAIEREFAWSYDDEYIYKAFYRNETLKIFKKLLTKEIKISHNIQ